MIWIALLACGAGPEGAAAPSPVLPPEAIFTVRAEPPSSVAVRCEADGDVLAAASSEAQSTHTVHLRGLLAGADYRCEITADSGTTDVAVSTRPLPEALATMPLTPAGSGDGVVLTNLFRATGKASATDHFLVILDDRGQVRWHLELPGQDHAVVFEYLPEEGQLLAGGGLLLPMDPTVYDLTGVPQWSIDADPVHEVKWATDQIYSLAVALTGFCVQSHDHQGALLWSACDDAYGSTLDDIPANTAVPTVLGGREVVLVAQVDDGPIAAIDRQTSELRWTLGPGAEIEADLTFDWIHDLRVVPCDDGGELCLLFYDNGQSRGDSRATLLSVDEAAGTATAVRTWTEAGWYEPHMGGVDLLPNGDWLIARGHSEPHVPDSPPTSIVRVTPTGDVAWRLDATDDDVALYRARWIDGCEVLDLARCAD